MKYNELSAAIKSPVFSRHDLALSGHKVFDYQLSLWVKKGYLVRLKNGIYAFSREKEKLRGEGIAFLLYQPSYLSLGERSSLVRLHPGDRIRLYQCHRQDHPYFRERLAAASSTGI